MTEKKVAIVTGASRGIGNAIAVQLAREGFIIATIGSSSEKQVAEGMGVIREYCPEALYFTGSIASSEDRQRFMDTVTAAFGRLDVLVNNAGVAPKVRMDLLETTEESMDYVLDINLKGTFFLTQAAANYMIRELDTVANIKPTIVNISSISAYTSSIQRGEYCISKAGMSMVTALFADRLAQYGINVYEIRPGVIATDMTAGVKEKYDRLIENGLTPIKRWGLPEDVARAVSVICSGTFGFSTGEIFNVDGGFHLRRL